MLLLPVVFALLACMGSCSAQTPSCANYLYCKNMWMNAYNEPQSIPKYCPAQKPTSGPCGCVCDKNKPGTVTYPASQDNECGRKCFYYLNCASQLIYTHNLPQNVATECSASEVAGCNCGCICGDNIAPSAPMTTTTIPPTTTLPPTTTVKSRCPAPAYSSCCNYTCDSPVKRCGLYSYGNGSYFRAPDNVKPYCSQVLYENVPAKPCKTPVISPACAALGCTPADCGDLPCGNSFKDGATYSDCSANTDPVPAPTTVAPITSAPPAPKCPAVTSCCKHNCESPGTTTQTCGFTSYTSGNFTGARAICRFTSGQPYWAPRCRTPYMSASCVAQGCTSADCGNLPCSSYAPSVCQNV